MHGRHPHVVRRPGTTHTFDGRSFKVRSHNGEHLAVFKVADGRAEGVTLPGRRRFNVTVRPYGGIVVKAGLPKPVWFMLR